MWRNEWNNILFLSSFSLLFAVSPGTIEVAELVTNNKKMQHPDWLLPLSLWPVKFIHCCTVAQLTPPTFLLLFWLSPPPSLPSAVSAWCRGWGKRINTHTHTYIQSHVGWRVHLHESETQEFCRIRISQTPSKEWRFIEFYSLKFSGQISCCLPGFFCLFVFCLFSVF